MAGVVPQSKLVPWRFAGIPELWKEKWEQKKVIINQSRVGPVVEWLVGDGRTKVRL